MNNRIRDALESLVNGKRAGLFEFHCEAKTEEELQSKVDCTSDIWDEAQSALLSSTVEEAQDGEDALAGQYIDDLILAIAQDGDVRSKILNVINKRENRIREAYAARVAAKGEYTYSSKQKTKCAGCGNIKHTPLRRDEMGGYVCLTCIDQELDKRRVAARPMPDLRAELYTLRYAVTKLEHTEHRDAANATIDRIEQAVKNA